MQRVPNGRYTGEFREEAVKMVTEGGLSVLEVSSRLSLPKSALERWRRVSKRGNLGDVGKGQRPLTEIESELVKILKKSCIVSSVRLARHSDSLLSLCNGRLPCTKLPCPDFLRAVKNNFFVKSSLKNLFFLD